MGRRLRTRTRACVRARARRLRHAPCVCRACAVGLTAPAPPACSSYCWPRSAAGLSCNQPINSNLSPPGNNPNQVGAVPRPRSAAVVLRPLLCARPDLCVFLLCGVNRPGKWSEWAASRRKTAGLSSAEVDRDVFYGRPDVSKRSGVR